MLLPALRYLSLDDQGGDGNADSVPCLSLKSAFTQVRRDWGKTKQSWLKGRGALPLIGAALTWSGWERVILKECLSISEQCQ